MTNILQRLLAVLFFIFLSSCVYSQSKYSELTANGSAKLKVPPDVVTLTLSIEKIDTIEQNSIKSLNIEIDNITSILTKIGFPSKAIKVSDYKISSSTDDDRVKRYTAANILKVQLKLDNKLLDAFYTELQINKIKDLDVSYESSLSEELEKETRIKLVQLAIEDAKSNANNISKTLSLNINKIKQVFKTDEGMPVYSMEINQVKFTPPKIVADTDISYKTSFDKYQVEEVELIEKITIVYEISK